jgi:hypothetical protein
VKTCIEREEEVKTKEWVREEIIEGPYGSSCALCQEQIYPLVGLAIS